MQESVWAFHIQTATQQTDRQVANSQYSGCFDCPFWLFNLGLAETGSREPFGNHRKPAPSECELEILAVVVKQRFLVFIPDLQAAAGAQQAKELLRESSMKVPQSLGIIKGAIYLQPQPPPPSRSLHFSGG